MPHRLVRAGPPFLSGCCSLIGCIHFWSLHPSSSRGEPVSVSWGWRVPRLPSCRLLADGRGAQVKVEEAACVCLTPLPLTVGLQTTLT